jgi:hypothetical protein
MKAQAETMAKATEEPLGAEAIAKLNTDLSAGVTKTLTDTVGALNDVLKRNLPPPWGVFAILPAKGADLYCDKMKGYAQWGRDQWDRTKDADQIKATSMMWLSLLAAPAGSVCAGAFQCAPVAPVGSTMQVLQVAEAVGAASGVPVSKLFGKSASGLAATGEGDAENWFADVGSYQTRKLSPPILRAMRIYSRAKDAPTGGEALTKTAVEWPPLQVPTAKEEAEAYLTRANGDAVYIDKGVIDPAAVAVARFGRGRYSPEAPTVDVDALQAEINQRAAFDDPAAEADPETPGKPSDLDTETGSGANVTIHVATGATTTEGAALEQGEANASTK